MRRISFTAALAIAAALALTGGTAAAAPKDPGLGERVEIRINKNAKLGPWFDGPVKTAHVKFDYRCAPSPNMELVTVEGDMWQPIPNGGGGPAYGPVPGERMRCTGKWRTATIMGMPGWEGSPPYRKGPVNVSMFVIFVDYTAGTGRFGQTDGAAIIR